MSLDPVRERILEEYEAFKAACARGEARGMTLELRTWPVGTRKVEVHWHREVAKFDKELAIAR